MLNDIPGPSTLFEENFETSNFDTNDFIVPKAPTTICYIPNFITEDEEEYLLDRVENAPKPKWDFLKNRRLQNWGGIVGKKSLIPDDELPQWLEWVIDKIMCLKNGFHENHRPNHVLINEYLSGQGIMPHTDGPAFYPLISTINLSSHTFLDFYEPIGGDEARSLKERYVGSMFLEPRSLILIKDDAYQLLHGIEERDFDVMGENVFNRKEIPIGKELKRTTRVSLTIRNVPQVAKRSIMSLLKKA